LSTALFLSILLLGALSGCGKGTSLPSPNPTPAAPSKITLTAGSSNLLAGATDSFTAIVDADQSNGANMPTGIVNFYEVGVTDPIGSAPLVSGKAISSAIAFPMAGTYNVTAIYQGDAHFTQSTSASVPLTITPNGTTPGTYTVTVKASGASVVTASTSIALTVN
jgi:pseudomonalisin